MYDDTYAEELRADGRRQVALEQAVALLGHKKWMANTTDNYAEIAIDAAKKFEDYLKGENA